MGLFQNISFGKASLDLRKTGLLAGFSEQFSELTEF